jgi:hypothetical protein
MQIQFMLRNIVVLGFVCASTCSVFAQIPPADVINEARGNARYYIEFRVATIGAYGHSYVAYGMLNAKGQPIKTYYTDLHPMGNYLTMAVGHLLPVPANTEWDPDVLKLPISSLYRHVLSETQYQKLLAAIREASEKQPYWNALINNCNHYAANLARSVGLLAPTELQISYLFVPGIRALNEGTQKKIQQ